MYFFIFTLCTCLFFFIHFIIICEVLYLEYLHLVIVSCIFIILFSISFHKSHSISNKSIHPSLSLKYCTKCEMHIDRYDHHCYFLDNCVGKHNYKYYCLTLLYAVIADIFYIVTYILFISGNPKKNMVFGNLIPLTIAFTLLTLLVPLLVKHIQLIKKKQTTYESVFYKNICKDTMDTNEKIWKKCLPL